jgi:hypothetical protein
MSNDDMMKFVGINHDGITLHLFFLRGDREAERFSMDIKQVLGLCGNLQILLLRRSRY